MFRQEGGGGVLKRGVAPLVASVILVGIVIVVVAVVGLWGRGVVEDLRSKGGDVAALELQCTGVRISVVGAANGLVSVENSGRQVEGVAVVARGEGEVGSVWYDDPIEEGGVRSYAYGGIPGVGVPERVTVVPTVGKGIYRPCSEQKVEVEV